MPSVHRAPPGPSHPSREPPSVAARPGLYMARAGVPLSPLRGPLRPGPGFRPCACPYGLRRDHDGRRSAMQEKYRTDEAAGIYEWNYAHLRRIARQTRRGMPRPRKRCRTPSPASSPNSIPPRGRRRSPGSPSWRSGAAGGGATPPTSTGARIRPFETHEEPTAAWTRTKVNRCLYEGRRALRALDDLKLLSHRLVFR
jgi:hypothetical protein